MGGCRGAGILALKSSHYPCYLTDLGLAIRGVVEENTSWHPTPYVYRTIVELQRISCEKSSTVTVIVAVSVTLNVVESGKESRVWG